MLLVLKWISHTFLHCNIYITLQICKIILATLKVALESIFEGNILCLLFRNIDKSIYGTFGVPVIVILLCFFPCQDLFVSLCLSNGVLFWQRMKVENYLIWCRNLKGHQKGDMLVKGDFGTWIKQQRKWWPLLMCFWNDFFFFFVLASHKVCVIRSIIPSCLVTLTWESKLINDSKHQQKQKSACEE